MSERFDAVVIGLGPGGEVAAGRLLEAGKRVAVIERELIGGECAYWACIPSKTLLRATEAAAAAGRVAGIEAPAIDWPVLKPQVLGALMEHFISGRPVLETAGDEDAEAEALIEPIAPEDAEVVAQIRELLDTRVRPAVAGDGGDIVFRGYRAGVVKLHMQGSCSGCPSSRATLKHGIENMLRHYVPEVTAVEQVEL